MNRKNLITFIKIIFAASLIFYLSKKGILDFSVISEISSFSFLCVLFFLAFVNLFINTFRWYILLKAQNIEIPVLELLKLSFIGLFFNYAMPSSIGGDVVKGYYLISQYKTTSKVGAGFSILLDRLIGFYGMSIMAVLVIFLRLDLIFADIKLQSLSLSIFLVFLCFSLFFIIGLSQRLKKIFRIEAIISKLPKANLFLDLLKALDSYRNNIKILVYSQILSFCSLTAVVGFFYFCAVEMAISNVSFYDFMFVVPLGLIAMAAPIAPAGVGVGQAAYAYLFALVMGESSSLGANAITLFQFAQLTFGLFGLYYYLRFGKIPHTESKVEGNA